MREVSHRVVKDKPKCDIRRSDMKRLASRRKDRDERVNCCPDERPRRLLALALRHCRAPCASHMASRLQVDANVRPIVRGWAWQSLFCFWVEWLHANRNLCEKITFTLLSLQGEPRNSICQIRAVVRRLARPSILRPPSCDCQH